MRKKKKNVAVMVLGVALTGAVLTGCGESPQSRQDTQQGNPANISEKNSRIVEYIFWKCHEKTRNFSWHFQKI